MNQLIIGVAGASGCGKSYLVNSICKHFNKDHYQHFDMDGYHFHNRNERQKLDEYPEDIHANDFSKLIDDLHLLQRKQNILIPTYNHRTGKFGKLKQIKGTPIIFIEGLHAALINELAVETIVTLPIYIDTDEDIRNLWKMQRDVLQRAYSYQTVVEQIEKRRKFIHKYIHRQSRLASINIETTLFNGEIFHRIFVNTQLAQKINSMYMSSLKPFIQSDKKKRHELVTTDVLRQGILKDERFHLHSIIKTSKILDSLNKPLGSYQNLVGVIAYCISLDTLELK